MSEYANGVATLDPARLRGRTSPAHPAITLSSGYTITVRRMAAGTMAQLRQQAIKELDSERPTPPVQRVEVGPGEWRDVERSNDPDHLAALSVWEARVNQSTAMKWLRVVQSYAVLTPTDDEAVGAYREAMAAAGAELADDDREIFLWSIAAPTSDDVQALTGFILGISEPSREAVQAHAASFRGDVPGTPPGALDRPDGAQPL
jgi:hypothetical protein